MKRGVWFAAGAGAGVYAMVKARRAAEIFTPEGLSDRLKAWQLGARMVREEIAQGRAEAETDLRGRLDLVPPGHRVALNAAPAPSPLPAQNLDAGQEEGSN